MAKILITDDAIFMRLMLGNMLREAGFEVCEAENGRDMLQKYDIEKPDLVTLDITMPEMDGREALKLLREKDPKAKVIMCSAMGQRTMVLDAIQAGACDFIVKPFDRSKVLESIRKTLAVKL